MYLFYDELKFMLSKCLQRQSLPFYHFSMHFLAFLLRKIMAKSVFCACYCESLKTVYIFLLHNNYKNVFQWCFPWLHGEFLKRTFTCFCLKDEAFFSMFLQILIMLNKKVWKCSLVNKICSVLWSCFEKRLVW